MKYFLAVLIFILFLNSNALAVSDPRLFPNNKFGINSLSPEADIKEVADLVNTNGDWGWVVLVIRKNERDLARWQAVFDLLLENHLIPIVRIATQADSEGNWQRPTDADASDWANFLSELGWPTKNHYVQIYNEVNHNTEWGGNVDAADYAMELNKTIDNFKVKSANFFVLNAPLDLAANSSKTSVEAGTFFEIMEKAVPGIFNKLDGWASHSYPNPDFSASPLKSGRTGIDGYKWELAQKNNYSQKQLSVFITETGWRSSNSKVGGLSGMDISNNYKIAFEKVWNDNQIVVVAPFVFNYPDELLRAFSFKEKDSCSESCQVIRDLIKVKGEPERENKGKIIAVKRPLRVINNTTSKIDVEIKNIGNYVWNTKNDLKINIVELGLVIDKVTWNSEKIYPGHIVKATISLKVAKEGILPFFIRITSEDKIIDQTESYFRSESYFTFMLNTLEPVFTPENS